MPDKPISTAELRVFVTYSRADTAFADELVEALEFYGAFDVSIDRQSIIEGEDWRARIGALIAAADTIVFILSLDSVQSEICQWEVGHAESLSKRLMPVLWRSPGSYAVPGSLAALNYVRFDENRSFMKGVVALVQALNADIPWLREHTRLLTRAREWNEAGRTANRLLNSADVIAANTWIADRPADAPEVTDLHLSFLKVSETAVAEHAEKEQFRRTLNRVITIAGILLISALTFAASQWFAAARQKTLVESALSDFETSLCGEAIKVTTNLNQSIKPAVWDQNYEIFWFLYWGPMRTLEKLEKEASPEHVSLVEIAMVKFGDQLVFESRKHMESTDRPNSVEKELIEYGDQLTDEPFGEQLWPNIPAAEARAGGLPRSGLDEFALSVQRACNSTQKSTADAS